MDMILNQYTGMKSNQNPYVLGLFSVWKCKYTNMTNIQLTTLDALHHLSGTAHSVDGMQ